jgi:hypothetical protein
MNVYQQCQRHQLNCSAVSTTPAINFSAVSTTPAIESPAYISLLTSENEKKAKLKSLGVKCTQQALNKIFFIIFISKFFSFFAGVVDTADKHSFISTLPGRPPVPERLVIHNVTVRNVITHRYYYHLLY